MNTSKRIPWLTLSLVFALIMVFAITNSMAAASPSESQTPGVYTEWLTSRVEQSSTISAVITDTTLSQSSHEPILSPQGSQSGDGVGDVLEVFDNAWSYSTIGLVYDPDRSVVRYAHESQSSKHKPTVYDVEPISHTVLFSFALSSKNSGWPWQIDNRDGAGYDYATGTYFMPDYEGDLSYADDNIVEVNAAGKILNAWEMDNEVGSNDSSDGSKIDCIIDIAVVPGEPTRYFAVAAYDKNTVYEINLKKTGRWWTPKSWSTLKTYTVPTWGSNNDNLGIDYDAQHDYLYHSDWKSTQILVTDLEMNYIASFDCPGAGGYNSGVTFIEGSNPSEVWVTDFSSDKTTRCQAVGEALPDPGWDKQIDRLPWVSDLSITAQTSDTVQVTDIITAARPFTLTENWDTTRLAMFDLEVTPALPEIITTTGSLNVIGGADSPEVITITKSYLVQPSTWTETVVSETLTIEDTRFDHAQQPFTVTKLAPVLTINTDYQTEVLPGSVATYTLAYSNTGGFENDVEIRSTFPLTAPLIYADPSPNRKASDGTWAEWDAGNMSTDDQGNIDVYVYIDESLSISNTVTISSGIYNHVDDMPDSVDTVFHVNNIAVSGWQKSVDGVAWSPTISVTKQVSETFEVVDVISTLESFALAEVWEADKLELSAWTVQPAIYSGLVSVIPGGLSLIVPMPTQPITLTKTFTVKTCTWSQTILGETFLLGSNLPVFRAVTVNKVASDLWLNSINNTPQIYGGETVTFNLPYGNNGGFENMVDISSYFPPGVSFVSSDPMPTIQNPISATVGWNLPGGLTMGQSGMITLTAYISDNLPVGTVLEIPTTILDHAGSVQDTTLVTYQTLPPDWHKTINEVPWSFDLETPISAGQIFTVTDVITTGSDFTLVDRWNADQLSLVTVQPSRGSITEDTGRLIWNISLDSAEMVSITRWFRTRPFTDTYAVLWEDLSIGGEEWERRSVSLENTTPYIIYMPMILGN
ncbi:MAG: hypothetical protein JW908_06220 [Anaerolineales bacterium]|nr:hypothetical protein [Anaerolineales bacterium]